MEKKNIWAVALICFCMTGVLAGSSERLRGFQDHERMKKDSPFAGYGWRFIGPVWPSGRITAVAGIPGNKYGYYVGTASGGAWKTENEGTSWEPIFENGPSTSIGDLAVVPGKPEQIWLGLGESNSSRSCYSGTGVYFSPDGGRTWTHKGLTDTHHIGGIVVDPGNCQVVYVAALGHLYSFNQERGIFKTVDNGQTWQKILYVNDRAGFAEVVMDPSNTQVLYAVAWERLRQAWNMSEAGPGSGIYKTMDGGNTWRKLVQGLPQPEDTGRMGVAIAQTNPSMIYVLVDNQACERKIKPGESGTYGMPVDRVPKGAEVYRSDDSGVTWKKVNQTKLWNLYNEYGYYFGKIRVDPTDEKVVYILGVPLMVSSDRGETFRELNCRGLHADHHALWIDPADPRHIVSGNDGGLNISYDKGQNWRDIANLPVVQFYNVSLDQADPFRVYGSAQDHGCFRGPVNHQPDKNEPQEWESIPGGEASYLAVDPANPDLLYSENLYGSLSRYDFKSKKSLDIKPKTAKGEPGLRCNWLTPFIVSLHRPYSLYFGSQYLHCSVDQGDHWQTISPDLSKNDPRKNGDVPFGAITTISESPLRAGLIYAGTDDGNLAVTKDRGGHWTMVQKGLPRDRWISRVVASGFKDETVYVTLNGYREDDFKKYIYKSVNYGLDWRDISGNIPCGPVNVITEDPVNENILYVGTDLGVYISVNSGQSWDSLGGNMPDTYIHDLALHKRDRILVAATHGRGMYALDVRLIQDCAAMKSLPNIVIGEINPVKAAGDWEDTWSFPVYFYLGNSGDTDLAISDKTGKKIKEWRILLNRGYHSLQVECEAAKNESPGIDHGEYFLEILQENQKKKTNFFSY